MADKQDIRIISSSLRLDRPVPSLLDQLGDDLDDMLYGPLGPVDDGDDD